MPQPLPKWATYRNISHFIIDEDSGHIIYSESASKLSYLLYQRLFSYEDYGILKYNDNLANVSNEYNFTKVEDETFYLTTSLTRVQKNKAIATSFAKYLTIFKMNLFAINKKKYFQRGLLTFSVISNSLGFLGSMNGGYLINLQSNKILKYLNSNVNRKLTQIWHSSVFNHSKKVLIGIYDEIWLLACFNGAVNKLFSMACPLTVLSISKDDNYAIAGDQNNAVKLYHIKSKAVVNQINLEEWLSAIIPLNVCSFLAADINGRIMIFTYDEEKNVMQSKLLGVEYSRIYFTNSYKKKEKIIMSSGNLIFVLDNTYWSQKKKLLKRKYPI